MFKSSFRNDIAYLCMSLAMTLTTPAVVMAEEAPYKVENFTAPLSLSRGKVVPLSPDGRYLNHEDSCHLAQKEWGWDPADCPGIENLLIEAVPGLDTVVLLKPNSEGHNSFEEWTPGSSELEQAISDLWSQFQDSLRSQSQRLGKTITADHWYIYPTLRKEKSYLYYAVMTNWDGEPSLSVKAILFDRYGYVPFGISPDNSSISQADLEAMIERFLSSYQTAPQAGYQEFRSGDRVAEVGALGVLATVMGVKYGKVAAVGLIAGAILIAKKLAFVFIALPVILFRKIFGRRTKSP